MPVSGVVRKRGSFESYPLSKRQQKLLRIHEMTAPVLLPARFIGLGAERFLLAVADRLDAVRCNSRRHERILHRTGTVVAERKIVLGRTALVAVSLDRKGDVGMLLQEGHIRLDRRLLIGANVGLVVIEVDVLDILRKHLLVR